MHGQKKENNRTPTPSCISNLALPVSCVDSSILNKFIFTIRTFYGCRYLNTSEPCPPTLCVGYSCYSALFFWLRFYEQLLPDHGLAIYLALLDYRAGEHFARAYSVRHASVETNKLAVVQHSIEHFILTEKKCMYVLRPRKCKILAFWNELPCDVLQLILIYHSCLPKHSYFLRNRRKKNYLENNFEH